MSSLFDNIFINGMELKNRFIRSATWERLADDKGYMTEELMDVYKELSKGNVGLIITGYAFVLESEKPNPGMMGIYEDDFIDEYKALTEAVHENGSKIVLQIAYGGSQTNYKPDERVIWGPSKVAQKKTKVMPKKMTEKDINTLIKAFKDAASRAKKAGFDGVQIHGAHGYLLSQFLNPYHNRRKDKYGGSIENRARIIFQIYKEIRKEVGKDYPVLIKLNCCDFFDEGMTLEESKYVSKKLSELGIDAIEISGGIAGAVHGPKTVNLKEDEESFYKDYAKEIAKDINTNVILVGGNRSLDKMDEILNNTAIKYFSLSRPLLREPNLIKRWEKGDTKKAKCISCSKCFDDNGNYCVFKR
ncbi:MAG: NADH:flavin oxidoreductase [Firmicutes bacterium]|nr:NADH:flavin oxidoreductase [Bacillota bacterium]